MLKMSRPVHKQYGRNMDRIEMRFGLDLITVLEQNHSRNKAETVVL